MKALMSVLPHLITVTLLWLAAIIIVGLIKKSLLTSLDKLQIDEEKKKDIALRKKKITGIISIINIAVTVVAAGLVVLVILFVYNPTERSYEQLGNIETASVDKDFAEPNAADIEALNVKSHDVKKSQQKQTQAQKENLEAMREAMSLFGKTAQQAQDTNASNVKDPDAKTSQEKDLQAQRESLEALGQALLLLQKRMAEQAQDTNTANSDTNAGN
jgi:hypothetical protein